MVVIKAFEAESRMLVFAVLSQLTDEIARGAGKNFQTLFRLDI